MFRKPYKVKTSTTMKGSDRRKLRCLIETQYPNLTLGDLNALIPNKSEMNQIKVMLHVGTVAMIYCSNNKPIFFLVNDLLYPSVYTLWHHPSLLPTVITVPAVLEKICNGADLMAPGIIINELTVQEMANVKINNICAIRISGNKSPIAVGVAVMTLDELCTKGIKGKAVFISHNYKDHLWLSGSGEDPPLLPDMLTEEDEQIESVDEEANADISQDQAGIRKDDIDLPLNISEINFDEIEETNKEVLAYTMDDILYKSFVTSIKVFGRKIPLPILTSTFYSSYVLKSCPPQYNLNIKKTTYKKLSVFLKQMQKDGIVQIKELSKGVESLVSLNMECESVKQFYLEDIFKCHLQSQKVEKCADEESTVVQESYKFPAVTELFVVSAQVKCIFEFSHLKKGETVTCSTVRDVLKEYIIKNSLRNEQNPREVILDPILSDCIAKKGDSKRAMTWEDLYEAIVSKMPNAYKVVFEGKEPIIKKGKLEPIQITVDTRTGNKKVTLILNLETYGINPEKLAHHVQVAVAASTSVTPTQNGKGFLVLIQGNQVLYLKKLFLEIYKVPRKYIQGLENVPLKKK